MPHGEYDVHYVSKENTLGTQLLYKHVSDCNIKSKVVVKLFEKFAFDTFKVVSQNYN